MAIDIARGMCFLHQFDMAIDDKVKIEEDNDDDDDNGDGSGNSIGIIHHNLTPRNCLIGEFGNIKISNFKSAHQSNTNTSYRSSIPFGGRLLGHADQNDGTFSDGTFSENPSMDERTSKKLTSLFFTAPE
eukprot:CAMPEP_0114361398 /NCGR_PEP_ID=MMETSP0101-20121206/24692_1 /TAXON_ID=38822 ORGANISM="Pteridomonas danica, Strain PT" /NCGR_SAMPLE_ID=MMETSP0101 /ASSEMBLY_ACC=CAM_ASM_000211 /LENGTH=129 /DNA_ID=CAMNT_0001506331 /DNA_START=157 /DNA_END=543 /DNA_ORIENTATION=-